MNLFNQENLINRLKHVKHFQGLSDNALKEIVIGGQILRYPAGSIIFHEGDSCAGLYVLFSGKVHLLKSGLQGQSTIIGVINPVIMFNEVTVIDGGPNPVTATVVEDCVAWQLSCSRYQSLLERYPEVGTGLLKAMAVRNRMMLTHLEDIISRPIQARVAKTLLDLSDMGSRPINRYRHTNQEIAARVATVHEAVSRALRSLSETGAITYTRSQIKISSITLLAKLAQLDPIEFD